MIYKVSVNTHPLHLTTTYTSPAPLNALRPIIHLHISPSKWPAGLTLITYLIIIPTPLPLTLPMLVQPTPKSGRHRQRQPIPGENVRQVFRVCVTLIIARRGFRLDFDNYIHCEEVDNSLPVKVFTEKDDGRGICPRESITA